MSLKYKYLQINPSYNVALSWYNFKLIYKLANKIQAPNWSNTHILKQVWKHRHIKRVKGQQTYKSNSFFCLEVACFLHKLKMQKKNVENVIF